MKKLTTYFLVFVCLLCSLTIAYADNQKKSLTPMLSILLSADTTMEKRDLLLSLMVATDTDKIEMAWVPGSDGITPVSQVQYKVYLSTSEDFTIEPANLKKTVTGVSQTEVTGLATDTLYFCKVVAEYSASTSAPSNSLQSKTYKYGIQYDNATVVVKAADIGLGQHTTTDGITYTYSGGTPPPVGSVLFSEDVSGGITLRLVVSASESGGVVTVLTSDASLTDVLDRGAIYSSFQLFDVASQARALPSSSKKIATARSAARADGSTYSYMEWKDNFLIAEQTNYAYKEESFSLQPQGKSSLLQLKDAQAKNYFDTFVTSNWNPKLITEAEWGGIIFKHLDSAKIAAKGRLSFDSTATFNFTTEGRLDKDFDLFKRRWVTVYPIGALQVYQEIILTVVVETFVSAQAAVKAVVDGKIDEDVEIGARYERGVGWTPYIDNEESDYLVINLDIAGKANAEIRLIPKIEVGFFKVVSGSLTVEPFIESSLSFADSTENGDFLTAHAPNYMTHLTSFDAFLGLECHVEAHLSILGNNWDLLSKTCVLGTDPACTYNFNKMQLFSIPDFTLTSSTENPGDLTFQAIDGIHNSLTQDSITWEVYPTDASVTPGTCSKAANTTICSATVTPGTGSDYTVFASGHGIIGDMGRQFREVDVDLGCFVDNGDGTVSDICSGRMWQKAGDGDDRYTFDLANSYCQSLELGEQEDWRLPTHDELKSIVYCSTGAPIPLENIPNHPSYCNDGYADGFAVPTIDRAFQCPGGGMSAICDDAGLYWSSTIHNIPYPYVLYWYVDFSAGMNEYGAEYYSISVMCVR